MCDINPIIDTKILKAFASQYSDYTLSVVLYDPVQDGIVCRKDIITPKSQIRISKQDIRTEVLLRKFNKNTLLRHMIAQFFYIRYNIPIYLDVIKRKPTIKAPTKYDIRSISNELINITKAMPVSYICHYMIESNKKLIIVIQIIHELSYQICPMLTYNNVAGSYIIPRNILKIWGINMFEDNTTLEQINNINNSIKSCSLMRHFIDKEDVLEFYLLSLLFAPTPAS